MQTNTQELLGPNKELVLRHTSMGGKFSSSREALNPKTAQFFTAAHSRSVKC